MNNAKVIFFKGITFGVRRNIGIFLKEFIKSFGVIWTIIEGTLSLVIQNGNSLTSSGLKVILASQFFESEVEKYIS